jgi:GTP:adenosylcobinamide-phosphate guanylyltransferase
VWGLVGWGRWVFNVNTPEDYAQALQMLESESTT